MYILTPIAPKLYTMEKGGRCDRRQSRRFHGFLRFNRTHKSLEVDRNLLYDKNFVMNLTKNLHRKVYSRNYQKQSTYLKTEPIHDSGQNKSTHKFMVSSYGLVEKS